MSEWNSLDKELEEKIIKITDNTLRFIRPKASKTYSLSCSICNNIIGTSEDMEMLKQEGCCENCHLEHYYKNKDKWEKGWRPEINNK